MQTKYIIQFDLKGKYGIRVCTMSGFAMGYFCHMNDAIAWCEANPIAYCDANQGNSMIEKILIACASFGLFAIVIAEIVRSIP